MLTDVVKNQPIIAEHDIVLSRVCTVAKFNHCYHDYVHYSNAGLAKYA